MAAEETSRGFLKPEKHWGPWTGVGIMGEEQAGGRGGHTKSWLLLLAQTAPTQPQGRGRNVTPVPSDPLCYSFEPGLSPTPRLLQGQGEELSPQDEWGPGFSSPIPLGFLSHK